jgi:hypothetical protein
MLAELCRKMSLSEFFSRKAHHCSEATSVSGWVGPKPGVNVIILKIFSPKQIGVKMATMTQIRYIDSDIKNIETFKKIHNFFRTLVKIAENNDHYIEPRN